MLFHVKAGQGSRTNPMLARVFIEPDRTRVDFAYQVLKKYVRGGWIRIAPYTHIKIDGIDKKFGLIEAIGIPISPNRLEFESKMDWQYFTLIFEPIPLTNSVINILEEENPSLDDFNFYHVEINLDEGIEVID